MIGPHAVFALADGTRHPVFAGSVIGRLASSPLPLHGPGVSEAHALLSYRGAFLQLISLSPKALLVEGQRGGVAISLAAGQHIELAPQVVIEVVEVHLPAEILVLEVAAREGGRWTRLGGLVGGEHHSIPVRPAPALVAGIRPDATWQITANAREYTLLGPGGAVPIHEDLVDERDGWRLRALRVPAAEARVRPTAAPVAPARPFTVHLHGQEEVQICPQGAEPLWLRNKQGSILNTLLRSPKPVGRHRLVHDLFDDNPEAFSTALSKLRRALKAVGADPSLVIDCNPRGEPRAISGLMWVAEPYRLYRGPLHRWAEQPAVHPRLLLDDRPLRPVSLQIDDDHAAILTAFDSAGQIVFVVEAPLGEETCLRLLSTTFQWDQDPRGMLDRTWSPSLSEHPCPAPPNPPIAARFVLVGEVPAAIAVLANWLSTPGRRFVHATIEATPVDVISLRSAS